MSFVSNKELMFDRVISKLPKNAKIADFGCGAGVTLMQLYRQNPDFQLFGLDVKKELVLSYDDKRFLPNGVDVSDVIDYATVDFNKPMDIPDRSFDCIISQHVIEHLHNPLVYFSEMVRTLKVGGYLFLEAPSDRSTWFSYPFNQELNVILSFYDDPTHVGRPWSPQSLYRLGHYHNLDVVCAEYDSDVISKVLLPINFVKFLITKDTDKFVDAYWKALGWCSYAVFRKSYSSSHELNYFSFKGFGHGIKPTF